MKKLLPVIPALIILCLSVLLFIFMCMPPNPEISYEKIEFDVHFLRTRGVYLAALGGILFLAMNQIVFYIFKRQEKDYLLFSIFCITYAAHTLFTRNGLNDTYGWIPYGELLIRIRTAVAFLSHIITSCIGFNTFRPDLLTKYKNRLTLYFIIGMIFCLLAPFNTVYYEKIIYTAILIVCIIMTAMFIKSPLLKESKWVRLYFCSFILYLLCGIFWIFIDPGTFLMPGFTSVLFMVMSHAMLLSKKYADTFKLVEETNQNLEQIVEERTNNLQKTNDAMKELVSNISHDLKTPLAVMSVNLESLSSLAATQSNDDYQRYVRAAYQKNLDLQRLIQNLFEVSRIETDRQLYNPKWESLLLLLARVKEKYDDYIEDHGLAFDIDIPDDMEISADPLKIWSVFDNIIYNAVKHTESGGITITARREGSLAFVTITDTGSGIEPEHLPRVFERFYKGSQARNANEGESGLGLYIVKSVMEGCGGSAEIESEPGRGTSVILTFNAR